jgi:WD40 repeat protein
MGSLALSADGKFLMTTERPINRSVLRFRKWSDLSIERERQIDAFNATRFSPDGKVLAVASQTTEMQLWDVNGGRKLHSWKAYDRSVPWFTFSDDSKTLVTGGSDKFIRLWDVETGKKKQEIVTPSIVGKAFVSRDSALAISSGMIEENTGPMSSYSYPEKMIRIWDVASGKELRQLLNPAKAAADEQHAGFGFLGIAPDGKTVITTSADGLMRFWDPGTGKEKRKLDVGKEWATALAYSPDGKTLALAANAIRLIDLTTGKDVIKQHGQQSLVTYAGFVLDGRTALTTYCNQDIHLWNSLTGQELGSFTWLEEWAGNETSVDKGRFLIATGPNDTVRIYDLVEKKEIRRHKIPPARTYIQALSPNGDQMAFAAEDKGVVLMNLKSGKESRLLQEDEVKVTGVAFSAGGETLIVWFADHTLQIWDLAKAKNLRRFALGYGPEIEMLRAAAGGRQVIFPYNAFISPDSRYFAYSPVPFRSFALYELPSLRLVRRSGEFPGNIAFLRFSPDNRMIAYAGHDSRIHLLEVATCKDRLHLAGNQSPMAFSSDGRMLISGGSDSTALVWDLTGKLEAKEKWGGPLSAAELDSCWSDLADVDAAKAYQAIRRLAASPGDAVPYLGKRLKPVPPVDPKHLAKLVADLDSNEFGDREAAEKELEKLGELAVPACQKTMEGKPSTEIRRRLKSLFEKQTKAELDLSPERLRAVRVVEILEFIGTREARHVLTKLAQGASEASLTQEAKTSLDRLAKRSALLP